MFSSPLLKLKRAIKRALKVQSASRQIHKADARSKSQKLAILLISAILIGVFYPGDELLDPLDMPRAGDISYEDIEAPFRIPVTRTDKEIQELRNEARLSVPYVLDYDTGIVTNTIEHLHLFFGMIDSLSANLRNRPEIAEDKLVETVSSRFPMMSETAIRRSIHIESSEIVASALENIFLNKFYEIGMISDKSVLSDPKIKFVIVRKGEKESLHNRKRLIDVAEAQTILLQPLEKLNAIESSDVELYNLIGRSFLHPNLHYNASEYLARLGQEFEQISNVKEVVKQGDIIVRAGARITKDQERKIEIMTGILQRQAVKNGWFYAAVPVAGRILLTFLALGLLFLYLFYFRSDVYNSNKKLLAVLLVFAIQLVFIKFAANFDIPIYAFPVAMLPIVITVLFDAQIGIISAIALALLLGVMHRFDFTLTFLTISMGTVTSLISSEVRRRTQFIRIVMTTVLSYMIFVIMIESLKLNPAGDLQTLLLYAAGSGFVSVVLSIFFIPFVETLFSITTDLTLLELSDLNHPLLKRLALEAPGTYHHSISVGNLCEAAAKAIDANPLLARVGAYFHDIGKIEIPEYFVENQLSIKSKHEQLTPTMSALILSSHVKRGRQLGEKEDIPDDVLNFIEEHHGTMVQTYFYNKAIEQGSDPKEIDKFRYPGPKPQIRETGIAMLADAVEAASRTLDDPKPARINNLIQRIINDRFESGELDECPLTLRDLAKIREAFSLILIAAFHRRIEYPKRKEATAEVS